MPFYKLIFNIISIISNLIFKALFRTLILGREMHNTSCSHSPFFQIIAIHVDSKVNSLGPKSNLQFLGKNFQNKMGHQGRAGIYFKAMPKKGNYTIFIY